MGYSAETMTAGPAADTQTGLAEALAEVLAEVMRAEHVPADSDFFTAGPPIDAPAVETKMPCADRAPGMRASM